MALGDVASGLSSISASGYLDIRPSQGTEWVIHNIYHEDSVQLEFYDGTNSLIFDVDYGMGIWAWYEFHCTYTIRIRVKNLASSAKLIGYDGVVTKA